MDRSEEIWESSILPSLSDFIGIKALSPLFEPNWAEMGDLMPLSNYFASGWTIRE